MRDIKGRHGAREDMEIADGHAHKPAHVIQQFGARDRGKGAMAGLATAAINLVT